MSFEAVKELLSKVQGVNVALEVLVLKDAILQVIAELERTTVEGKYDSAPPFTRGVAGVVLDFGKHKGKTLHDIAELDSGYLEWMLREGDFPMELLDEVENALAEGASPFGKVLAEEEGMG